MACAPAAPRAADVTVFAAASLRTALESVAADWSAATGHRVRSSYAASSALAKQIALGAPADIFVSSDLAWMDYLQERGLIAPETRRTLFGNRLVLVAPAGRAPDLAIAPAFDLAGALEGGRLAIANVESVPAGRYGKAALESLGVWASVVPHLAQAENVRVALALVARGEAPLGIVYATDAADEPAVAVVGTFPADSHPPILYPAALTAASTSPAARALLDHLLSPAAAAEFLAQGFTPAP